MMKKIKIYFHVHTQCSKDAIITLKQIEDFLSKNRDAVLVITDHDTIRCAKLLRKKHNRIISGVEMSTRVGDIIGFFIDNFKFSKDPFEFIYSVKREGGLLCIPHPKFFEDDIRKYENVVDFIEVFNGRRGEWKGNISKLKPICGCDAHSINELSTCHIEMTVNRIESNEIKEKLLKGEYKLVVKHKTPRVLRIYTYIRTLGRTLKFNEILIFIKNRLRSII